MHGILLSFAVAGLAWGTLDATAWKAYEAVEEAWLHERHGLLVQQAPAALNAARMDLDLRLAELHRKALKFKHMHRTDPAFAGGAVWRLSNMVLPMNEEARLAATAEYRKVDEQIRQLTDALKRHPQYEILKRAQTRLWKTPQYRDAHRRYTGRLQDLQSQYGSPALPSVSTVN